MVMGNTGWDQYSKHFKYPFVRQLVAPQIRPFDDDLSRCLWSFATVDSGKGVSGDSKKWMDVGEGLEAGRLVSEKHRKGRNLQH